MLDPLPPLPNPGGLTPLQVRRLSGRSGADAGALLAAAGPGELETIPGTLATWAELRWAARAEAVCHLDDLLLRRVRLGLLLPQGGEEQLPRVRAICQPELGWSDRRWEAEAEAYRELWDRCYRAPAVETAAGNTTHSIGVALPMGIRPPRTDLVAARAALLRPHARPVRGNRSAGRAGICRAPAAPA